MASLQSGARGRLLLEAAFAAANYGLEGEVARLMLVIPLVTSSRREAMLCQAFMLWGLGRGCEALDLIEGLADSDAAMLRRVIVSESGGR